MPTFDLTTQTAITNLRALRTAGTRIQAFEIMKIDWDVDGAIYYGVMPTDEVADPAPSFSVDPRIIPENNPDWFLSVPLDSTIGDEEIDLEMWDGDEVMSQRLIDNGEGCKIELYYWFPQESLLLPVWHGHLRNEDEAAVDKIKFKAVQGFRSSDANVPGRAHYQNCSAIFGGVLTSTAEVAEHDCPYDLHLGGSVGINDPGTGLPWTYCNRLDTQSCIDRGVDPKYHLSHRTITATVQNNQSHGPNLLSMSQGNETNLKDPVRVVMGLRRIHGMQVLAFRRDINNNDPDHGWFYAMYEVAEGPIRSISQVVITVGGQEQNAVPMHYNYRLGTRGQTSASSALTPHGYSGTAHIIYNFGWCDPSSVQPGDASASAIVEGLNNIRIYTDDTTYTEQWTSNRAWQLARILCDKRWGYGYDYDRLDMTSWIAAADWCDQPVRYTDTFGDQWDHIRSDSHPELKGKKVQQQIEDLCMAGRLSRPFLFNGKIHVVPLRALTSGELETDVPVFTDEGDSGRNIIWEDDKSTLTISRKSDLDLPNRIECTFDDQTNNWLETPLNPVEDVDAQLAAGRVVGDKARKINPKKYALLGVTNKNQAIKMAWSLLDLGPHDEGGLQNNLSLKMKIWFIDSLDLHMEKVIKVDSSRLLKYGFSYFRIKKMKRLSDLKVELELQAYNETYMDTFESDIALPTPVYCDANNPCPEGFICVGGVCVPEPPPCRPGFGTVTYEDGMLRVPIDPC